MKTLDQRIAQGEYARKQLLSPSRLIAWSHRRRVETGLRLARKIGAKRVLDFGCGDGMFLALLAQSAAAPAQAVGADLSRDLVADCRRRLGRPPALTFVHTDDLDAPEHRARYDLVVCMEVLEHVVDPEKIIARLAGYMAPGGRLLVSVPVETGPAVLVKQSGRRIAGWLGVGDYPGTTPYRWPELIAALLGGERQRVIRPVHRSLDGSPFHDHKGFNWKLLRREIAARLTIEATHRSPLSWLPPAFASQVWFVARR